MSRPSTGHRNTLDVTWLKDALSPFVTYDSQSVHRNGIAVPLRGRRAVMAHWSSKIETLLRNSDRRPRFELATTSNGDPCAAGCQPTGELDQNWLDVPIANLTLQTDTQGLITSALMITVAPNPAAANHRRALKYPPNVFIGLHGTGSTKKSPSRARRAGRRDARTVPGARSLRRTRPRMRALRGPSRLPSAARKGSGPGVSFSRALRGKGCPQRPRSA